MSAHLTGSSARVLVPATSANLGPGFDSLGLALDLVDEVGVTVVAEPGARVVVEGAGAGEVPGGEHHLVVRALRVALVAGGVTDAPGLELRCTNRVPHGRGLGSSAAAVVAGVLLGRALAAAATGAALDDDAVLALATSFEGHPDNAAAALMGGATIAWQQPDGPRAVGIDVHADVVP
ncbi:MAG TPA: homoserine kinase, partial [Actinomycetales bacterium]